MAARPLAARRRPRPRFLGFDVDVDVVVCLDVISAIDCELFDWSRGEAAVPFNCWLCEDDVVVVTVVTAFRTRLALLELLVSTLEVWLGLRLEEEVEEEIVANELVLTL